MRTCKKCLIEQPIEEFYFTSRANGNRSWKCKECTRADVRANRHRNIDYYRDYDRHRAMQPHRVAQRLAYSQTRQGIESGNKAKRAWRERNPIKRSVADMVNNAVRDGKIDKPDFCEECGQSGRIEGHHDDYAKPLEVRWLCRSCHCAWHKKHGEAKNGVAA